ncbi:MAG: hypothetical protein ACRDJJ_05180 [Actinomycetota bacterium]
MRSVHIVPHTHWDREWYLPFEGFRDRLVETLDLVLDLLASDDRWTHFHLDGQTAMIDDYLEARPERTEELRAHVRSGRLSCGPWVTLVDEFLVSGESILRNLEDGMRRAEELGGATSIGYLPDQFGHVGQMPQILRAAGIERAVVWRGVPDMIDRSSFTWSAPDGSRVQVSYLPFGYGQGRRLQSLERLRRETYRLEPFLAGNEPALLPVGSDHQRPNSRLPDLVVSARAAGIEASIVSLSEHLEQQGRSGLEWRGELRSAARAHLLPNTYSVRAHQKVARARAEHLIERYAEPLAALVPGATWPADELAEAWRLLHLNGAHDSVCGCSTDEVARAVDARTRRVTEIARRVADRELDRLAVAVEPAGVVAFNPSPFARHGIPPLGWRTFEEFTSTPRAAETEPHLSLEDQEDGGDLYTFSPKGEAELLPVRLQDGSAHVAAARFDASLRAYALADDDGFVRVDVSIDNRAPNHRVRLIVELPEPAETTRAGSAFEIVERPRASEGGATEPPSPCWPARGFVIAGGTGVMAEHLFEYELTESALAVTLLRCVGTISCDLLPTRTGVAGPDVPTPEAQMLGRTELSFGILVRDTDEPIRVWESFALPPMTARASGGGPLPGQGSLLDIDAPALSSVRRVDGRLSLRLWNPAGRAARARVGGSWLDLGPHRIETIDL